MEKQLAVADEMRGVEGLRAITQERQEQLAERPLAWSITEGEHVQYRSHWRMTLEEVIAEELRDWQAGDTWDRAIWRGERLMAVIRPEPDGSLRAIRIDGEGKAP